MQGSDEGRGKVRLVELRVADEAGAWAAAGFAVDVDVDVDVDVVHVGPVAIRLTGAPAHGPRGITGWTVAGLAIADDSLDGLPTRATDTDDGDSPNDVDPPAGGPVDGATHIGRAARHPNGVVGLDHVVVATPDLERTIAACEAAGLELRRIREATNLGSPMRQAFFKLGPVVLEVVSGDLGTGQPAEEAPATFWGLAVDVEHLDATAAVLGEGLGRIKPAVQRGRRIATVRHRDLGLSVPIAAMDRHADRTAGDDGR